MYSTNKAYYEPDKKIFLKFSFFKLGTILAFSHGTLYLMSADRSQTGIISGIADISHCETAGLLTLFQEIGI